MINCAQFQEYIGLNDLDFAAHTGWGCSASSCTAYTLHSQAKQQAGGMGCAGGAGKGPTILNEFI